MCHSNQHHASSIAHGVCCQMLLPAAFIHMDNEFGSAALCTDATTLPGSDYATEALDCCHALVCRQHTICRTQFTHVLPYGTWSRHVHYLSLCQMLYRTRHIRCLSSFLCKHVHCLSCTACPFLRTYAMPLSGMRRSLILPVRVGGFRSFVWICLP